MITYSCNKCGGDMQSPTSMIGKMEKCPVCQRKMKVPSPSALEAQRRKEFERRNAATYSVRVAGVTKYDGWFRSRQRIIKRCRPGDIVVLVREPQNPYDTNAVGVCVASGDTIGYINRKQAQLIAGWIDKGYPFIARVASVGRSEAVAKYGVSLIITWLA